ncbi:MAG TPA: hypothetical protein VKQ32_11305 [Polyangia bacterium]|nr:hypothetical protein [Polyangia bacterium]
MQAQTVDRSYAAKLLLGLLVLAALMTVPVFRPRRPSQFTEHGAFGAGYGRESIMFGARARKGAAP